MPVGRYLHSVSAAKTIRSGPLLQYGSSMEDGKLVPGVEDLDPEVELDLACCLPLASGLWLVSVISSLITNA